MNRFIPFILTIFIFFFSCKSLMGQVMPDKNNDKVKNDTQQVIEFEGGVENIKHNLDRDKIDLFEAYIETVRFMNHYSEDSKEYKKADQFMDEIINRMNDKINNYIKEKKYQKAINYSLSLKAMGKDSAVPLSSIYDQLSASQDQTADIFTKIDTKEQMADLKLVNDDFIFNLLKYQADNKSRNVFLYELGKYSRIYPDLLKDHPELNDLKESMLKYKNLDFEELMKSVVVVVLDKGMNVRNGMKFYDKSLGTGFFIDGNGYILTNHHVIADNVDPKYKGYSEVKVFTRDKPEGPPLVAKVVGYDKVFDIALLKVPFKSKNYLTLGRSMDVSVGDKIYTIGNPLGIQYTLTSGIISNKDINAFQLGRCFMIDAAVNPGNSGGPLIDNNGQVIGIVFAGIPNFQNLNFAIPFEWVRKTITALYKGGEVKRCWIGTGIYEEDKQVKFYYVMPDSPASKAGIEVGDRLVKIDGQEVKSVEDAQSLLAWSSYPRLINIETERDNKIVDRIVRLEERPYMPVEKIFNMDTEGNIVTLVFGIGLEYYEKNGFFKKYITKKLYKGIFNSMFNLDLNIAVGDPITIYDLKYTEKDNMVRLSIRYRPKNLGVTDRFISVGAYAGINSIL